MRVPKLDSASTITSAFFTLAAAALLNVAPAQDRHTVQGTVTNASNGTPIPGVNVVVKGSTIGTTTDAEGTYRLRVPSPQDTLAFSFVGFERQVLPIRSRSTVDVAMRTAVLEAEELVVTGYQTQRRADVTGAVSTVDAGKVQQVASASLQQSLEGRVAGLDLQSSGAPGGGDAEFRIRGYSTAFGTQKPLYVIDGVPTQAGIRTLNPRDIESIQVLKDASAASVYGARAANGVIVITTEQADENELNVNFDSYVGTQSLTDHVEVLDAREWGEVYWRARNNDGLTNIQHPQYEFEQTGENSVNVTMPEYIDPPDDGNGEVIPAGNTDWFDVVFDPALEQQYNLSLSKSTENANVTASGSYFRQDGIIAETWFDRYTMRVNSDYEISDRVRIGENFTVDQHNEVRLGNSFTENVMFQHPLVPVYKEEPSGEFAGPTDGLGDRLNPLGVARRNQNNEFQNWRLFGNVFVEADVLENLTLKSSMGLDYSSTYTRFFTPRFDEGTQKNVQNELSNSFNWGLNWTWSNTAEYDATLGNHSVNVLGGVEAISEYSEGFSALRREFFLNEDTDYHYLGAGSGTQTNGGSGTEATLFSLFSKADYNYDDTYLASFTLRRDASSRLGQRDNTDIFPAFSLGWRMSNESFMSSLDVVDNLKLRVGWGQTGGQGIGDFAAFGAFGFSPEFSIYDITGDQTTAETGFYRTVLGNQDLGWERTTEYNAGLDLSMFGDRLTIAADYFIKSTEDLLLQPTLLGVQGEGAPPFINAGALDNRGLELEIGSQDNAGDLNYDVTGTVSIIRNNVESLTGDREFLGGAEGNRIQPGHPISRFYGYVANGLFQNQEEVAQHAEQEGKGIGRIRYKDLNDDGVIDDRDRTWIGNPHPDFSYGLNLDLTYQGFDFSLFFQGEQGKDIFNSTRRILDFARFNFNWGANTLDAWTPQNRDTEIPRLTASDPNNEGRVSSYFVEDGSYLKLKRATLGYTLPTRLISFLNAERARFYVQAQDLFTITGYSGNDPEIGVRGSFDLGIDRNYYPHARKLTVGVELTF